MDILDDAPRKGCEDNWTALPRRRGRNSLTEDFRTHSAELEVSARPYSSYTSYFASIVILVLSSFEIGQPAFAFSAAFSTAARLAPGAWTVTSRWLDVTAKPLSVFSRDTVADAEIFLAVILASPS